MHKPITRDIDFNILTYGSHCILFSTLGILFGYIVNKITYSMHYNYINLILQVLLLIILIYIIHFCINRQFVDDLQGYVAGIFFVAFFFGTQTNIYNYLDRL